MTAPGIDPITLEVIRHALSSIADEMALVVMRSAYSSVVRDTMDYSTALCDSRGEVVAQGLTLAVQLGSFPDIMGRIVAEYGNDLASGDILIANDPYGSGGQHLPDIYVIKPIFVDRMLRGYAATMAHHSDVGGIAPGSVAIHATEIYQEGLRLPLLKLSEGGRLNRTLLRVIERNTRIPTHVLGDLRAQMAACRVAETGLVRLVEKYGAEVLATYLDQLQEQAERQMREEIARIPDGQYTCEDFIDGVGEVPEPVRIAVRVTVDGDEITLDFTGTSGQVEAAINCPVAMVHSAAYCAIRCIAQRDIPNCQGYMRPVHFVVPPGTVINPVEPAACGARGVIGYRVFDAIMGALARVVPERVIAGSEGGPILFSVGGRHDGRPFVLTEVLVGTWGARAGLDGVEGISNPAANLSNAPVEIIESEMPLQVTRYGLVPDSGGPGEYRGGLAFVREFRFLAESADFTLRADRRQHPPYGVAGGQPGAPSENAFVDAAGEHALPTMPMRTFRARRGDRFRVVSAGGGGFGDPLARAPERVLADVREDKVTIAAARAQYGVIVDPATLTLDLDATYQLRASLREEQVP